MPVSATTLRKLMAAGLSGDDLLDIVESIDADNSNAARSKAAERQARYRARRAQTVTSDVTNDVTRDVTDQVSPDKERSPTPPKEIKPLPASLPFGSSAQRAALDGLQDKLVTAAGISGFRDERHPGLLVLKPIIDLIEAGYSLDTDILPVIRDRCAGGFVPKSWGYFTDPVIDAAAKKRAIPQKPIPAPEDWGKRISVFKADGTWAPAWGPKPGEQGCRCPPDLIERAAA